MKDTLEIPTIITGIPERKKKKVHRTPNAVEQLLKNSQALISECRNKREAMEKEIAVEKRILKKKEEQEKIRHYKAQSYRHRHPYRKKAPKFQQETKFVCRSAILDVMTAEHGTFMSEQKRIEKEPSPDKRQMLEEMLKKKSQEYNRRLLKLMDMYDPKVHMEQKSPTKLSPLEQIASMETSPAKNKRSKKQSERRIERLARPGLNSRFPHQMKESKRKSPRKLKKIEQFQNEDSLELEQEIEKKEKDSEAPKATKTLPTFAKIGKLDTATKTPEATFEAEPAKQSSNTIEKERDYTNAETLKQEGTPNAKEKQSDKSEIETALKPGKEMPVVQDEQKDEGKSETVAQNPGKEEGSILKSEVIAQSPVKEEGSILRKSTRKRPLPGAGKEEPSDPLAGDKIKKEIPERAEAAEISSIETRKEEESPKEQAPADPLPREDITESTPEKEMMSKTVPATVDKEDAPNKVQTEETSNESKKANNKKSAGSLDVQKQASKTNRVEAEVSSETNTTEPAVTLVQKAKVLQKELGAEANTESADAKSNETEEPKAEQKEVEAQVPATSTKEEEKVSVEATDTENAEERAKEDEKASLPVEKTVANDSDKSSDEKKVVEWISCEADDGNVYYYNTITGDAQWEKPESFDEKASETVNRDEKLKGLLRSALEGKLKKGQTLELQSKVAKAKEDLAKAQAALEAKGTDRWVEAYDPTHDMFYYYNTANGESSWDKPEHYVMAADDEMMNAVIKIQCLFRARRVRIKSSKLE